MWDDIISTVKLVDDDIEGGRPMLQESNRIEFKVELNDKLEKEVVALQEWGHHHSQCQL